jgi:NAD(P)-dependent dehydrogenase (short-subunit alcohol dehydrogenase family)
MLHNKVAVITGAASGIGREVAILFSNKDASPVLCDVDKKKLFKTAGTIEKQGGRVLPVVTDVSNEKEVKKMINETIREYGKLDIACNNAGVSGELATTADYSVKEWDRVMNINLKGQWLCMKYEIPAMLKNGEGSIINVSSILGTVGFANAPAYTAAKHGLIGLTKTAALEYAAKGIRINAIAPAFIETPMLEKAGITTDEEMKASVVELHPMARLGRPEEVADAAVWLASDESSFVTGHTLLVDGGYTVR